jgi:hypothetical protein
LAGSKSRIRSASSTWSRECGVADTDAAQRLLGRALEPEVLGRIGVEVAAAHEERAEALERRNHARPARRGVAVARDRWVVTPQIRDQTTAREDRAREQEERKDASLLDVPEGKLPVTLTDLEGARMRKSRQR